MSASTSLKFDGAARAGVTHLLEARYGLSEVLACNERMRCGQNDLRAGSRRVLIHLSVSVSDADNQLSLTRQTSIDSQLRILEVTLWIDYECPIFLPGKVD